MSSKPAFPSLLVTANSLSAQGAFAETQAAVLDPDPESVRHLNQLLAQTQAGIVAHYYMAPELQGVLLGCEWPHVHVSDSLQMADRAVEMARAGAKALIVLGVDFMSENVRALLDAAGFADIPVLRAAAAAIGCSLAEAAETPAYQVYVERAAQTPRSVHVVYINTSLATKAAAEARLPTITCTSSNVVSMVLQCFAQVPEGHVWFGPDTYMGQNLAHLLESLADLGDSAVRAVHPDHSADSVRAALQRFHYFEAGNCIVHHLFGDDVVSRVQTDYGDALITAHLEVPGAMFRLGLEAQRQGRGIVGSTSDILRFADTCLMGAIRGKSSRRLQVVLGTEAGLVTSLVQQIRVRLRQRPELDVSVEIVFPVASEAVAVTGNAELPVIPGVASGEGCSLEGGCATCPYMKMNHLDALFDVLSTFAASGPKSLTSYAPQRYAGKLGGSTLVELGTSPILAMRHFSKTRRLSDELVARVLTS
jgi:quinolinate synthase